MHEHDADDLGGIFEDLEQLAAGLELAERDAELADRARGEYAGVTLADRFHASVGREVVLTMSAGESVEGVLTEAGTDWCCVTSHSAAPGGVWLVRLGQVAVARGLSPRAVPEVARPVVARLGFGSALHRFAVEADEVWIHPVVGPPLSVRVLRVGADFAELSPVGDQATTSHSVLLSFTAVRAAWAR